MKAIRILLLPWLLLSKALSGLEAADLPAEPLLVRIEVAKEGREKALVPIRIQITNKTGRGIYLPFNVKFLSEFEFRPKGPALGFVMPPWSPSVEEDVVFIQPNESFSATTDLARFVRLMAAGAGEVEYEAHLRFSCEKDPRAPTEKFITRGAFTFHVTPEMVRTVKGDLHAADWTLKCTAASYRKDNKRHYGIALQITYSGEKPTEIAPLDERSGAVAILGPQTWVGRQQPQQAPTVGNGPATRPVIFGPGETMGLSVWLDDYFQPIPPGTYDLTVQLTLWTDDAKRKTPLVLSAPLRMTIGEN